VLEAGETRRDDAILPFKARWRPAGSCGCHRGTAHTFANAGPDPVHVLAMALPGGVEELFAEQAAYLASVQGPPDPRVLDEIGVRHGAPTVGPPIRSQSAPDA
jgi:hypothetical protein